MNIVEKLQKEYEEGSSRLHTPKVFNLSPKEYDSYLATLTPQVQEAILSKRLMINFKGVPVKIKR